MGGACEGGEEGQSGQAMDCLACEGRKRVASLCFPKKWKVALLLFCPQQGVRLTFEPSLVLVALPRAPLCPPSGSALGKAFGLPLVTEQHIPLQCRHVGDRPRAAEAAASAPSLHAAHGPLHWEDNGSGEELRPPDHGQEDIHQVSLLGPGSWLQAGQCPALPWAADLTFLSSKGSEVQAHPGADRTASGEAECLRSSAALSGLEGEAGWGRR